MAIETKKFRVACVLRTYVWEATVSKKTGKLLKVTAGCRTWKSLEDATAHYNGSSFFESAQYRNVIPGSRRDHYREEAFAIIQRLRDKITNYQDLLQQKKMRQRRG